MPCDIAFVGEAPGAAENALGKPFVGPAGQFLDDMNDVAVSRFDGPAPKMLWTNLVACLPAYKSGEISAPKKAEIDKCAPRLNEIINMAKPRAIVMVGKQRSNLCTQSAGL